MFNRFPFGNRMPQPPMRGMGQPMNGMPSGMPDPFGSMQGLQSQWTQFSQSYQGNPQEEVQRLLHSGRMTQQQYQAFQMIANRIAPFLGGR